ncbi:uncharacterized protein K452DRAFT_348907 [Aplosporella prunicola CBS 121167]|uniref:Zn(2)-C6 fungal-type domain-containing protein n=1 Tax=Aplosporella prunicola CBS 121167 TaxID=1176127 RepID=A0A6A6BRG0_9PEZI|nr:uncharacterized protein K452DRAFT_348907 [Aplosporella prunicola CBS 121167]KAF2146368.1 hypothetical protein K452DRAFT_348907 [Aplosporella prunicola CBS 121167]
MQSSSAAARIASRRSHRKSRSGCANCKRRRIKCDEKKPACTNCIRHSIRCDFLQGTASSSAPSTTPGASQSQTTPTTLITPPTIPPSLSSPPSPTLNIADLELLHNYCTSTAQTMSPLPALRSLYRINVPEIGFAFPFVMHGILAMSAIHLSHFKPARADYYRAQAFAHHDLGLREASALLQTNITEQNCHALYIFTIFMCIFTLGKGPKPGEFLLFSDKGIAEWLVLFRGIRSIIEMAPDSIKNGPLGPMFSSAVRRLQMQHGADLPENENITHLRAFIHDTTPAPLRPTYLTALNDLSRSLAWVTSSPAPAYESQSTFRWLYCVDNEFVALLQQRKPEALAIFAHFCVLLKQLDSAWWMRGWMCHLIAGIYYALDEEFRALIRWPMEEIGWLPA